MTSCQKCLCVLFCSMLALLSIEAPVYASEKELTPAEMRALVDSVVKQVIAEMKQASESEGSVNPDDSVTTNRVAGSWYGPRVTVGVAMIDTREDFDFAEIGAGVDVPWPEFLSFMAYGDLGLSGGLGYMRDEKDDEAALLIFGPAVTFMLVKDLITLEIASRPTLISESELGSRPLGGPIQFISHAGLRLRLGQHLELGGRIQHMSSAGFDDPNPGADIVAVDFLYRPGR